MRTLGSRLESLETFARAPEVLVVFSGEEETILRGINAVLTKYVPGDRMKEALADLRELVGGSRDHENA